MGEKRRKPNRRAPRRASAEFSRELVFYDDTPTQRKFVQKFEPEIDAFISAAHTAHIEVEGAGATWPRKERTQIISLFLHSGLNNLYCGVHFLVSGYFQAAGQQFRSYAESCAMAMLITVDEEWEAFRAQRVRYPAHDAMSRITRKKTASKLSASLGFEVGEWEKFRATTKLYNHHSHSGAFSLALTIKLDSGSTTMAGEWDPAKQPEYRAELRRAAAGADSLCALAKAIGTCVAALA